MTDNTYNYLYGNPNAGKRINDDNSNNNDDDYGQESFIVLDCGSSMFLVVGFVLANLLIIMSINYVLHTSTNWLGRSIVFAVTVAFVVLWIYDCHVLNYYGSWGAWLGGQLFGSSVSFVDIISLVLLLIGLEIYGRDPEPDIEVITNYDSPKSTIMNQPKYYQSGGTIPQDEPGIRSSTREIRILPPTGGDSDDSDF